MASLPNRYLTSIAVDPKNPAHAYVSFGSYSRRWIPDAGVGHSSRPPTAERPGPTSAATCPTPPCTRSSSKTTRWLSAPKWAPSFPPGPTRVPPRPSARQPALSRQRGGPWAPVCPRSPSGISPPSRTGESSPALTAEAPGKSPPTGHCPAPRSIPTNTQPPRPGGRRPSDRNQASNDRAVMVGRAGRHEPAECRRRVQARVPTASEPVLDACRPSSAAAVW